MPGQDFTTATGQVAITELRVQVKFACVIYPPLNGLFYHNPITALNI